MATVGMRTDCKHYESRTYPSGDVVRKCRLDLAPEAPWRCPVDCAKYERRLADAGWQYGSLGPAIARKPEAPPVVDSDVAALLDAAEEIVNSAGRDLLDEQEEKRRRRFGRKKNKNKKKKG